MNTYGIDRPQERCGHVSVAFKTFQQNDNNNNSNNDSNNMEKWKLLIFGGSGSYSFFNDLFILDIDSQTWSCIETTGVVPPPTESPCCVYDRVKHRVMIAFGRWENGREHHEQYHLDIDKRKWYRIDNSNNNNSDNDDQQIPEPRYAPGGIGIEVLRSDPLKKDENDNNQNNENNNNGNMNHEYDQQYIRETEMWIFGGYSPHRMFIDLWRQYRCYNNNNNNNNGTENYKWEEIQSNINLETSIHNNGTETYPNVFIGHCVVSLRNRFLAILSGYTIHDSWSNDIWIFDTQEYKWERFELGDHHPWQVRSSAVATVDPRDGCSVYIFGGVSKNRSKLNDLWKIDFSKYLSLLTSDLEDMFNA